MFSKVFFALAAVAASASALTVPRAADVVVTPAITSPTAGEIWPVGSTRKVTWDTTTVPAGSNITGVLLLGFVEDGSSDEHLDIEHPLASSFLLSAGSADITVPQVDPRDDYIVALIGDSGDISPKFSITN